MYIIFILFYLFINVNAELKHMPPENVSYIIEEGDISDGNGPTHLYVVTAYVLQGVLE